MNIYIKVRKWMLYVTLAVLFLVVPIPGNTKVSQRVSELFETNEFRAPLVEWTQFEVDVRVLCVGEHAGVMTETVSSHHLILFAAIIMVLHGNLAG